MTAQLIDLDSRRPKTCEVVVCLFCSNTWRSIHPADRHPNQYIKGCTGCEEVAGVPVAEWLYGR